MQLNPGPVGIVGLFPSGFESRMQLNPDPVRIVGLPPFGCESRIQLNLDPVRIRKKCTLQILKYVPIRPIHDIHHNEEKHDEMQCFGPGFTQVSGSGFRRAKMAHKGRKKLKNFMFLSAGCSLLRAEGFLCDMNVLFGGLGKNCSFLSKKKISSCKFFPVFGYQNPGSGLDPDRCIQP